MLEDLLDEEWVAFGLGVDSGGERGRGRLAGQDPQHVGHVVLGKAAQRQAVGQAATDELLESPGERAANVHFAVPIGGHHEDGHARETFGDVFDEQHGRLVCPLEVVKKKQGRSTLAGPGEDIAHRIEEEAPLLLSGQVEGRGNVRAELAQPGDETGDLRGVLGEKLTEGLWAWSSGESLFERLDHGDVGSGALPLVTVAHENLELAGVGKAGQLFGQAGLAHPGFASDHDEAALAAGGLVEEGP